ncbi:uncharacterized protein MKZ38_007320 [Zalerion maritima]|uniref:D-arabinitol 2-dehydrogenase n=1 Tax=Zalerion maritima TaxID=339359 RepID=A0AAD5RHX3_9PEZI|nr:uncharacterized protein MKZ38_007320 [Zalerion maritima]
MASRVASRLATRVNGMMPRPPVSPAANMMRQTRHFSATACTLKKDVIREAEVPVSVYQPDGKRSSSGAAADHFKINVVQNTPADAPEPSDMVQALTKSQYERLPKTIRDMTVYDKVVIVTGGARGLGNFMARALAEAGAKAIVLFDANQELGDASAAELNQKSGLPVSFFKVDVRDDAAIQAAVDAVVQTYGAPDVLVNSAGIADSNIPAEVYDAAMFRRLIDINLTGSFLMSKAVGNAMMKANKMGSIILVASMSGSIVNYPQEQSCYNASKAGVIQLGKSLAAEWAKYSIRVNMISPGYMDTALNRVPALDAQKIQWRDRTPQARLGGVDELNGLCVYLASDSSTFVTGSNMIIDGGYTLW